MLLGAELKIGCLRQCPSDLAMPAIEDLVRTIQHCRAEKNVHLALSLHVLICQAGVDSPTKLGNLLISLLFCVERPAIAQQVFGKLVSRNEFSWSCLILGCCNRGKLEEAISFYKQMLEAGSFCLNEYAVVALIMACGKLYDLKTGHGVVMEIARQGSLDKNVYVASAIVHMYAGFHEIALAQDFFNSVGEQNVVLWNALISCYSGHGFGEEALSCLQKMELQGISPDAVTLVCSLQACSCLAYLNEGEVIHCEITKKGLLEGNPFVGSSLVKMYIRCRDLETAREAFEKLPLHNTVTWNTMISGYAESGRAEESIILFQQMETLGFSPDDITFISLLNCCSQLGYVLMGHKLYCHILLTGIERSVLVGSGLVDMYSKCGLFVEAEEILTRLPVKDAVTWTSLISAYMEDDDGENVLRVFAMMCSDNVAPSAVTLSCVLKACSKEGDQLSGSQLHNEAILKGLESESLLSRSLIEFYASFGFLNEAQNVFSIHSGHDVFSQTALLVSYVEQGSSTAALEMYKHLQQECAASDVATLVCGLKTGGLNGAVDYGQNIHADLCKKGLESEPFVSSALVDMYAKCGALMDAEKVSDRTIDSQNAFLAGLIQFGFDEQALDCFKQWEGEGLILNELAFIINLKACRNLRLMSDGQTIHAKAIKKGMELDLLISNTLLDLYVKCGFFAEAMSVFESSSFRTVTFWTTIIAGCVEHGHTEQAFRFWDQMQQAGIAPSTVTLSCMLRVCGNAGNMENGSEILSEIVKKGMLEESISLRSTAGNMFAKQGDLLQAENVFSKFLMQDAVSWTILIAAHVECRCFRTALAYFEQMQNLKAFPIDITFMPILKCCAGIGALHKGQTIHSEIVKRGIDFEPLVGSTLVEMYAKCGSLAEAKHVFFSLSAQRFVSGAALIKFYMEADKAEEALLTFGQMEEGEEGSEGHFASVGMLKACVILTALAKGQKVHSEILKKGLERDLVVGNMLVDLYAKSGAVLEAEHILCRLSARDVVSWTSFIKGVSQVGMSVNVFSSFDRMVEEGVRPDPSAFLAILSGLSHSGLVEDGQRCFEAACSSGGFIPNLEHYTCLVDLISRAGLIENAVLLIMEMPIQPSLTVWLTLLGACRKSGNANVGRDAFEHAKSLSENDSGAYICLANIYADFHDISGDEECFIAQLATN